MTVSVYSLALLWSLGFFFFPYFSQFSKTCDIHRMSTSVCIEPEPKRVKLWNELNRGMRLSRQDLIEEAIRNYEANGGDTKAFEYVIAKEDLRKMIYVRFLQQ